MISCPGSRHADFFPGDVTTARFLAAGLSHDALLPTQKCLFYLPDDEERVYFSPPASAQRLCLCRADAIARFLAPGTGSS